MRIIVPISAYSSSLLHKISPRRIIPVFFVISLIFCTSAQANIIRDTEIEYRLNRVSLPLAQQAGFTNGVKIRIVLDPSYNAFVVGRDVIYIHSGLLLDAETDGEILGVIAHEIGHLAAGHVPRRDEARANASLATALTALAAIASAASGQAEAAAGIALGGTDRARRNYLATSRHDEAVADEWALSALDEAGMSATGLNQLMRRLAGQRALPESRQSAYYMTHPEPEDRLSSIEDHVRQSAHSEAPLPPDTISDLWRVRAKLSGYSGLALTRGLEQRLAAIDAPAAQDIAAFYKAYMNVIRSYRRGNLREASAQISALIAADEADPFFHELAGDIAFASGDIQSAADHYRTALRHLPYAPQIALSLGRALVAGGQSSDLPEAIIQLQKAVRGEPNWAFARRELGIAFGRNNQLAEAHLALSEAALLSGQRTQAIQLAERALRAEPLADDVAARARDILFQLNQPLR